MQSGMLRAVFLALAFSMLALPATGQNQNRAAERHAAEQIEAQKAQHADDDAALKRENALLTAQLQISEDAFSRFETITAWFGIVIALVVLTFGISTRMAAISAAKEGIQDELAKVRQTILTAEKDINERINDITTAHGQSKADVQAHLNDIQSSVEMAQNSAREVDTKLDAHLVEAEGMIARMRALLEEAESHLEQIAMKRVSSDPLSESERSDLTTATRIAEAKPEAERSLRDTLALIATAADQREWNRLRELAESIVQDGRDLTRSSSIYYAAVARFHAGEYEESLHGFETIVRDYAKANDPNVHFQFLKARINRAILLNKLGRFHEAVDYLRSIEMPADEGDGRIAQIEGRTRLTLAYALDEIQDYAGAAELLAGVIEDFRGNPDPRLASYAGQAAYNRACALAKLKRYPETSESLRLAQRLGAELSVATLKEDGDLPAYLGTEEGKAFLASLEG